MSASLALTAWRASALAAELLLLATHLKVLLCVGKPFSPAELSSKRWTYFLLDAGSPWNSLAAVVGSGAASAWPLADPSSSSSGGGVDGLVSALLPLLLVVALGHGALHLYYIATWHRQHAGNVIKMSAAQDMRSRWQRFSASEVAWFLVGTSYDIATHAAIAGLLAHQLAAAH